MTKQYHNIKIIPLPILKDNYIWILVNTTTSYAIAIDPGDAGPLIDFLTTNNILLSAVLITHHHADHCHGIHALRELYDVPIYAPKNEKIIGMTHVIREGDVINEPFTTIGLQVINIPGHTLDHVAYYMEDSLFCGDTLFSAGCGRLFEGTPEQMYQSLQKLAALPDETKVYCTHEYTLRNLQFAHMIEPDNKNIINKMEQVLALRNNALPTLPSSLKDEKEINPFLRCSVPEVIQKVAEYAGEELNNPVDVFRWLRRWKDDF